MRFDLTILNISHVMRFDLIILNISCVIRFDLIILYISHVMRFDLTISPPLPVFQQLQPGDLGLPEGVQVATVTTESGAVLQIQHNAMASAPSDVTE